MSTRMLTAAVVAFVVGCPSSVAPPQRPLPVAEPDGGQPTEGYQPLDVSFQIAGDRPVTVFVPGSYDPAVPSPLVLLLHGYGVTGPQIDDYLGFGAFAEANGLLFARPDGTVDASGKPFWNATDACCDFGATLVDDSAFLRSLVAGAAAVANVDPRRVYVIGHSNGGFMAQRLACDHADVFAAVVSIAGATTLAPGACAPSQGIAVLEVHGTADETIVYGGGSFGGPAYSSAAETMSAWAARNGCAAAAVLEKVGVDLDAALPGAETTIAHHREGCVPGGAAELWTSTGGTHVPAPNASFLPAVLSFLTAHAKP